MSRMDVITRAGIPQGEHHDDPVRASEQAVAALKALAAAEPDNADHPRKLSRAQINLAQLLSARREHRKADQAALESVAIMRRMLAR